MIVYRALAKGGNWYICLGGAIVQWCDTVHHTSTCWSGEEAGPVGQADLRYHRPWLEGSPLHGGELKLPLLLPPLQACLAQCGALHIVACGSNSCSQLRELNKKKKKCILLNWRVARLRWLMTGVWLRIWRQLDWWLPLCLTFVV